MEGTTPSIEDEYNTALMQIETLEFNIPAEILQTHIPVPRQKTTNQPHQPDPCPYPIHMAPFSCNTFEGFGISKFLWDKHDLIPGIKIGEC